MRSSFVPRLSAAHSNPVERRVLLVASVILGLGACCMLAPFWPAFLLALWTASLARPAVERLARAIRGRRSAAGVAVLTLIVALLAPTTGLVLSISGDAYRLAQRALSSSSGRAALLQLVSSDDGQGAQGKQTAPPSLDLSTLMEFFRSHGSEALNMAGTLAGALGAVALGTFVYLVATYAALIHGERAYAWLEAQIPVAPSRLRRMREAFTETGRGLLFSVALTSLVQGLIATVAYAAIGIPRAAVLGFATSLTSLIPTVGSALIWIPISIGLWIAGQATSAIVLFCIGVVVISSVDNVLRPFSARWGKLHLDSFLVLFSMLGGVLAVGGWGLVLGPLVLRLTLEAVSLLREVQPMGGFR
jgi:predicted PurR-regulated permease PerM